MRIIGMGQLFNAAYLRMNIRNIHKRNGKIIPHISVVFFMNKMIHSLWSRTK